MRQRVFIICALLSVVALSSSAQETWKQRISATLDMGVGVLTGNSNLSPYGIDYRKTYKTGFSGNLNLNYRFDDDFLVGLKFNGFNASGNYTLSADERVAEDLQLTYIAPQFGYSVKFAKRFRWDWIVGLGYLRYYNEGLLNDTERKFTGNMLGSNVDMTLTYRLFKGVHIGVNTSLMYRVSGSKLKMKEGSTTTTLKPDKWNEIKMHRFDAQLVLRIGL
jgi:hypothetical protein